MRVTPARFLAAAVFTAAAVTGLTAAPAHASGGHEVCDQVNSGGVLCENAWNGGPAVKTYNPNAANNNMLVVGVNRCNNGDRTTANCPISGNPAGLFIYQIEYVGSGPGSGLCVGDNAQTGQANLVGCNETQYPGTGGGTATIQVAAPDSACAQGGNLGVNSYYSNRNGGWANFLGTSWSGGPVGQPVYLNSNFLICLDYIAFG